MESKKCLIIYNPFSGKAINDKILTVYRELLESRGYKVVFSPTKYSHHATELVMNANNYEIVFSIGGDGTLNEVVKGNYLRDNRMIICPLPSGTCNDVATMLGYGRNPINNLKMALDGEIHNIDIGTINDSPFTYVVGMGKFMHIPYETKSEDKRKVGYIAYLKEALNEIFSKMKRYRTRIVIDGFELDGEYSLIMVSNANHIAGIDGFHKNVRLNDGKMEVMLCRASNQNEFVCNFLEYFIYGKSKNIISVKANEVKIKLLDKPLKKWCIDGECYDYDGDEYTIKISDKMEFLMPKVKTKKLFDVK